MTKPAKPPVPEGVVEMDAMDVHEWDAGQRTPQASDANLAALVKQSTTAPAAVDRGPAARPQFARTTQSPPRQSATGTPGIQAKPARPTGPRSKEPARTASGSLPVVRGRRPADERKDTAPSAPPPAMTFDTAPQPQVSFDDPTRVNPSAAKQQPQGTPMPGRQGGAGSGASAASAVYGATPAAASAVYGARPSASYGAVPIQSPFPSGAVQVQSPFPAGHEGEPLRYPLAVPEATAPPMPEMEHRPLSEPEPRVAPARRKMWWIAGAGAAALIGIVVAVMSGGGGSSGSDRGATAQVAERAPAAEAPSPAAAEPAATKASAATKAAATAAAVGGQPSASGAKAAAVGGQPSAAGGQAAVVGDRPSAGGDRPPAGGDRPSAGGDRPAVGGERPAAVGGQPSTAGDRPSAVGGRSAVAAAAPAAQPAVANGKAGVAHSTPAVAHVAERPGATRGTAGGSRPTRVAVATQRPRRPAKKPSKKLVVEYNDHASAAETPGLVAQAAEDPAIARARGAYVAGNEKLFAGDTAGAIAAYRESLGIYPGYVGGYRGLGLAYAQRGDTAQALEAFKTYVSAAPSARDVPLIKKRIVRLQHSSGRLPL